MVRGSEVAKKKKKDSNRQDMDLSIPLREKKKNGRPGLGCVRIKYDQGFLCKDVFLR